MEETPQKRFRTNFDAFLEFLEQIISDAQDKGFSKIEPLVLGMAKMFLARLDDKVIIEQFIGRSRSHWTKIYERDEKYLLDFADDIFSGLPVDKVQFFKDLFSGGYISDEDKNTLWEYYRIFVVISLKYLQGKGEDVEAQLTIFRKKQK
jgi:hypothetical protein